MTSKKRKYDYVLLESMDLFINWLDKDPRDFNVRDMTADLELQYAYLQKCEKLVEIGFLERSGKRRGTYRKRDVLANKMDLKEVLTDPMDIWLPFGLSDLVELYPGNLVMIAGAKSSGKTALMLNIIKENRHKFNHVHYFNSEMGAAELRKRLDKFDGMTIDMWLENFTAYSRYENFGDVVRPGQGNLNIIDFLEIHDDFYVVGMELKKIHNRLNGAIAIVGLQKNPGQDLGLGGWRSMEVTRLALALDWDRVKITEAKNYRKPDVNPRGLCKDFQILHGCQIIDRGRWYKKENGGKDDTD